MEMDLCNALGAMGIDQWGKTKVSSREAGLRLSHAQLVLFLEEGKRSVRSTSAHYASDRRRPRSRHVRLGRIEPRTSQPSTLSESPQLLTGSLLMTDRCIELIKLQRRRAIGLRSLAVHPHLHRSVSVCNDRRRVPRVDLHPPVVVRSRSTGPPYMCQMVRNLLVPGPSKPKFIY